MLVWLGRSFALDPKRVSITAHSSLAAWNCLCAARTQVVEEPSNRNAAKPWLRPSSGDLTGVIPTAAWPWAHSRSLARFSLLIRKIAAARCQVRRLGVRWRPCGDGNRYGVAAGSQDRCKRPERAETWKAEMNSGNSGRPVLPWAPFSHATVPDCWAVLRLRQEFRNSYRVPTASSPMGQSFWTTKPAEMLLF